MNSTRRELLVRTSLLGAAAAASPFVRSTAHAQVTQPGNTSPQRVAAIQFNPKLGDVAANLQKSDQLIQAAVDKGARWIVLPEFFTSGLAMHKTMLDAHRPIDGQPLQFLRDWAKRAGVYVGGSFLAKSGSDVYNTFVLACPDGETFSHDKDFPTTAFESSFFAGGEDSAYVQKLRQDGARTSGEPIAARSGNSVDGFFTHGGVSVGSALCWEIVRNRTAKRLRGNVDVLMASSGWWTVDPKLGWPGMGLDQASARWNDHQTLIERAPRRLARMLGACVVHANFAGPNPGFTSSSFDREANGRYLGSSQIVDAQGNTLAALGTEEGVLVADIPISRIRPIEDVPDEFWMPEVTESMRRGWSSTGAAGRDYYIKEVRSRFK